jgi:O-antigen/teichoic acid export membrane protein
VKRHIQNFLHDKNLKLPFVRDVIHSLGTKGITLALGLVASIIVTRTLGPELKGVYAIVITWVGIVMQISLFGLHASNSYYVALDRSKLKTLMANSLAFILVTCSIIGLLLLSARFIFKIPLGLPADNLLYVIILGSYLSMGNIILQNFSIAIKKVNTNNYVLIGAKALSVMLLVYFYLTDTLTVQNALLAFLLELLAIVSVLLPFLKGQDFEKFKLNLSQFKDSFSYGFRVYLSVILAFMVVRSDIFWVKYFLDFEQVGYYSTSVQITDQVSAVSAIIAGILMPRLTMIKDLEEKKFRTKQVVRVLLLMMAVIILPIIIFAPQIIFILFGESFLPCVPSLRLLLVATSFLSLQTILVQFLASEGFPKVIIYIWFGAFILNLGLNYILIPTQGIEGAAIASLISYFLVFVAVYLVVKKRYVTT